ncbi:MAG: tetratricopeptide repeat protein, partial [Acidobacteriota bacterium]
MKTAIIKSKHTILAVVLVLGGLIALDHGWFRQIPALAQAQGPAPGADCDKLRNHGDAVGATACYKKLAASREPFARAEGLWGLHQNHDANDSFREALKANEKDPTRRIRWGRLFMEDGQPAEAEKLFQEALKLNPMSAEALLGMAELATENFEGQAIEYAQKALALNPSMYEAYQIIARVHLDNSDPAKAAEAANKALAISPEALDALAVLATIQILDDKPGTEYLDRILKVNKNYGEAYALAAHFLVNNRRYDEGIQLYRKAIEIKPDLWSARAQLGVSLMRFGLDDEAKANLEACYNNGYKVDQVVNTLRLMDSYKDFNTVATPTMVIKLDKKEDDLLRPYVTDQVQQAMATYEKKYKYKLTGPFRLEVFPNHPDFEVRTIGMPGIGGILGVTF